MPIAMITPEHLFASDGPYVGVLQRAGFEVRYPKIRTLARGESSEAEIVDCLQESDAVLAGGESYSRFVIERLPNMRVIARVGVGYDRVDVAAATDRKIAVTITPNSNHECVAEHAMSLMFAAAKNTIESDRSVRAGKWERTLTQPLRGKTFGILGLGRIGRSITVRVRALGMNVIACESHPNPAFIQSHGVKLVSRDELFAQSDYLSLHCPASPETDRVVNRTTLALMKPTAVLINTARGSLIDESDLEAALSAGKIRAACLDVFRQEPPPSDHPLFTLPNVILAPHLGGMDTLSIESMGIEAAENIVSLARGDWPDGAVVNSEIQSSFRFGER